MEVGLGRLEETPAGPSYFHTNMIRTPRTLAYAAIRDGQGGLVGAGSAESSPRTTSTRAPCSWMAAMAWAAVSHGFPESPAPTPDTK